MKKYISLFVLLTLLGVFFLYREENNQETPIEPQEPIVFVPEEVEQAEPVSLSPSPSSPLPGEPTKITINNLDSASEIKSLTWKEKPLSVFEENGQVSALIGIDFHETPGSYPLVLTLHNEQKIESTLVVAKRDLISSEFDIPEHLGGNTRQAEQQLTSTLSNDSTILDSVTTQVSPKKLWDGEFRFPLDGMPIITDVYGYSRKTGSVSLSHLGTDFRAAEGTPVYAANSGTVAYTGTLRNFGETVIIDHGLGVMTMYMHLSQIKAGAGANVEKGSLIAESGNTGYSLGPHLHLSVRIGGLSIDPEKFYELMGPR